MRPYLEMLETRDLPSVTQSLLDGVLTIQGDSESDVIQVTRQDTVDQIVDNGAPAPQYSEVGQWSDTGAVGGYGNSYRYPTAPSTTDRYATWQVEGLESADYLVSVTWVPHANRASNAPFMIFDAEDFTLPVTNVAVNQRLAPTGPEVGGVDFQILATVTITSGKLAVRLFNTGDGFSIADAIRVQSASDVTEVVVRANGTTTCYPADQVGRLAVDGGAGADFISNSSGVPADLVAHGDGALISSYATSNSTLAADGAYSRIYSSDGYNNTFLALGSCSTVGISREHHDYVVLAGVVASSVTMADVSYSTLESLDDGGFTFYVQGNHNTVVNGSLGGCIGHLYGDDNVMDAGYIGDAVVTIGGDRWTFIDTGVYPNYLTIV